MRVKEKVIQGETLNLSRFWTCVTDCYKRKGRESPY
jgi:hypothetical protein